MALHTNVNIRSFPEHHLLQYKSQWRSEVAGRREIHRDLAYSIPVTVKFTVTLNITQDQRLLLILSALLIYKK